jgi:hypothetical protein
MRLALVKLFAFSKGFASILDTCLTGLPLEVSMHIHLSGAGMQPAVGAANSERAAAAERAAEVRKRLLKAGQSGAPVSDSGDGVSLLIGQWTDSRHSEVLPTVQYRDAVEGDDPDFA